MRLPDWIEDAKVVLITPLNWGLGHATRCIPIIRQLIVEGKKVILASDGQASQLLLNEFPLLTHEVLPAYNIHYKYSSMTVNVMLQSGKIFNAIRSEKKETARLIKLYGVDTIISDNRYGVFHNNCKNVIICHQIRIPHPVGLISRMATMINTKLINRFNECWIPDFEGHESISGKLSGSTRVRKAHYLGPLSRFRKIIHPIKRKWLIILSGPEPARTRLEEKLLHIMDGEDYLMIRGLPGRPHMEDSKRINFLSTETLNEIIAESEWVICRSGYTSIMDLWHLDQKAILIPTPGQGEQEYLAKWISRKRPDQFKWVSENKLETIFSSCVSKRSKEDD